MVEARTAGRAGLHTGRSPRSTAHCAGQAGRPRSRTARRRPGASTTAAAAARAARRDRGPGRLSPAPALVVITARGRRRVARRIVEAEQLGDPRHLGDVAIALGRATAWARTRRPAQSALSTSVACT